MADVAPRKRKVPIPVFVIGALLLVYGSYRLYQYFQPYEWSGTVEVHTIEVGSRAGGRVKDVLAKEGDHVKAGQPLLTLEDYDVVAQKLQAEGQLEQMQATLDKLEHGARPEEIQEARARAVTATAALHESVAGSRKEQIDAALARFRAAEALAVKAEQDSTRMKTLFASGAASQADSDNAETSRLNANAQRDAAKSAYDEAKNGVRKEELQQAEARAQEAQASAKLVVAGTRVEDIKVAEGAVASAKGRLDQMTTLLDEMTIKAPRDARIEALDLRPGTILAPNATAATLLEDGQLYVRIYVPETQLGRIVVGQTVPVTVDSFPHRAFKGVVEHINGVGEYSPRNLQTADERADQVFAVRIGLKEGVDVLKAGMAAFITAPK